jgi:glycosyltransferase involved in cell wall biosynthesis
MAAAGHDVTLITGGHPDVWVRRGVRVITLPVFRPVRFRTVLSPVRSLLGWDDIKKMGIAADADIIHAVDMDSICLLAWWRHFSASSVVTIQDYGLIDPANLDELRWTDEVPGIHPVTKTIRRTMYNAVLKRIRYAVCVSDYVKRQLSRSAPWVRSVTIGNCVPDDWFIPKPKKSPSIDVLYVGRLERYKGFHHFVAAVRQLNELYPLLRVAVVGDGSLRHLVHGMIHTPDAPFEHMLGYYRQAKIVVVPSVWPEPCGRTIIEAMAAGIPVVATRVGGTPESMRHNVHGLLVAPGNRQKLVYSCRRLLDSRVLRERMGNDALHHASRKFSVRRITSGYESFYRLIKTDPQL